MSTKDYREDAITLGNPIAAQSLNGKEGVVAADKCTWHISLMHCHACSDPAANDATHVMRQPKNPGYAYP